MLRSGFSNDIEDDRIIISVDKNKDVLVSVKVSIGINLVDKTYIGPG